MHKVYCVIFDWWEKGRFVCFKHNKFYKVHIFKIQILIFCEVHRSCLVVPFQFKTGSRRKLIMIGIIVTGKSTSIVTYNARNTMFWCHSLKDLQSWLLLEDKFISITFHVCAQPELTLHAVSSQYEASSVIKKLHNSSLPLLLKWHSGLFSVWGFSSK